MKATRLFLAAWCAASGCSVAACSGDSASAAPFAVVEVRASIVPGSTAADGGTLRVEGRVVGMTGRQEEGAYTVECGVAVETEGLNGLPVEALSMRDAVQFGGVEAPTSREDLYRDAPFRVDLPLPAGLSPGEYVVHVRARDVRAQRTAQASATLRMP